MRVSVFKLSSLAAYLAFVTGLSGLCLTLSRHVGTQAVTLAEPHLVSEGERPLTLVERRQIEAGPTPAPAEPAIVHLPSELEAPGISAPVLAAKLDVLERQDLVLRERRVRRGVRSRTARAPRPARLAAADAFGRSFGVMLMASR